MVILESKDGENQLLIRELELSVPSPCPLESLEGLDLDSVTVANVLINHTYVTKPPQKPKSLGCGELLGW